MIAMYANSVALFSYLMVNLRIFFQFFDLQKLKWLFTILLNSIIGLRASVRQLASIFKSWLFVIWGKRPKMRSETVCFNMKRDRWQSFRLNNFQNLIILDGLNQFSYDLLPPKKRAVFQMLLIRMHKGSNIKMGPMSELNYGSATNVNCLTSWPF